MPMQVSMATTSRARRRATRAVIREAHITHVGTGMASTISLTRSVRSRQTISPLYTTRIRKMNSPNEPATTRSIRFVTGKTAVPNLSSNVDDEATRLKTPKNSMMRNGRPLSPPMISTRTWCRNWLHAVPVAAGSALGSGAPGPLEGGLLLAAPARLAALDGREAEPRQGEPQDGGAQSDPDQAVPEERPAHGERAGVALDRRPVARRVVEGCEPVRVQERRHRPILDVREEQLRHAPEDEESDDADVGVEHAPGQGRHREEDRPGQEEVRDHQDRERGEIGGEAEHPDPLGLEPRHGAADDNGERHADEDQRRDDERAAEPAEEIVRLAHRQREEQRVGLRLEVAVDTAGDERGRQERPDGGHHQEHLHDDVWRVAMNVADRAPDGDGVGGDGAEGQQEEDGAGDPEHRLPELVADFEREDAGEHGV